MRLGSYRTCVVVWNLENAVKLLSRSFLPVVFDVFAAAEVDAFADYGEFFVVVVAAAALGATGAIVEELDDVSP